MKICLISNQIAAWGKIGGFGTATRAIGKGLVEQGHDVSAVVPRRKRGGQKSFEILDGISVYGMSAWKTLTSGKIFNQINADIYHSQEPTIASYFARKVVPDAIHIVTCRDPRNFRDHFIELSHTNIKRLILSPISTWLYEGSPWVKMAVRNADLVLTPAPTLLNRKIRRIYGSDVNAVFVPSPVDIPEEPVRKSDEPTIIFVGRWDRRKRIELFFKLANKNQHVKFIALGRSHDKSYDRFLRKKYGDLPNLDLPGYVSRFDTPGITEYYKKAWIIINTSAREGLPYTFIECLAYECAILSCLNPEEFASRFGYYAKNEDFQNGLDWLLDNDRWRELGRSGANYVRKIFNEENSILQHTMIFRELMTEKPKEHYR